MKRLLCSLFTLVVVATGCGESTARTDSFIDTPNVTALLGISEGTLRYATAGGAIYDADKNGKTTGVPLTSVTGLTSAGVLGLVEDNESRTYASWIDSASNALTIGQVFPGPTRIIYKSTDRAGSIPTGRLGLSGEGRIYSTFDDEKGAGSILSVDPDRNSDQIANVVSRGWNTPTGLAFAAGNTLWIMDQGNESIADNLSRAQPNGPTEPRSNEGTTDNPVAMTSYGDKELVVCFARTGKLQRFLINDGVRTLSGRTLAKDCASDVTQLPDGRLAYATKTEIRVTAL